MGETLSGQIIALEIYAAAARRNPAPIGVALVAAKLRAVKSAGPADAWAGDLLRPPFEAGLAEGPRLWLRRLLWRRQLKAFSRYEADSVLRDFGLPRQRLQDYLARPFWQP